MRNFKTSILVLVMLLFAFNTAIAQDEQPKMFALHTDNVNFDMLKKYEDLSKEFKTYCEKYNIQGIDYATYTIEDGRYIYVSSIEKMADLDKSTLGDLDDNVGKEAFKKLIDEMNTCYDSHSDSVIYYSQNLSYMPEGYTTDGKNAREFHFLYYSPKNAKAMRESIEAIKNLYKTKGVKTGYKIYHSGFGNLESYYMVSIAGTDELDLAQMSKENDEILGDERNEVISNLINLTTKYDQVNGRSRPDLSYYYKKE